MESILPIDHLGYLQVREIFFLLFVDSLLTVNVNLCFSVFIRLKFG